MRKRSPSGAAAALLAGALVISCATPPDKEMQRAQGALDAARAAGADQYAAAEYKAATSALDRSREAVTQRDYRLALSQALDSRELAENAARTAADQKAIVRAEAEELLEALGNDIDRCASKIKAAQAARVPATLTTHAQPEIGASRSAMQKAREAIDRHDYLDARSSLQTTKARLAKLIEELQAAIDARQAASGKRR